MSSYHVIKDPVHGTLQFTTMQDHWIKPMINHPVFQRLRHIKQLGLGDYIFPGAVHTRFNHSLGCCYVASQIANKLEISVADEQLVMLAALLHDVGHGPFSHAFEDLFPEKMIRHEDWTPYFLREFGREDFIKQYNQLNHKHPLDAERFTQIQAIIMHQTTRNPLLADIVSSQLDADRLDYLLRDSHFCGVTYGEYDFRWLLHCLAAVGKHGKKRLGVTYKGIGVVEHYLNARRLMIRNIYYHPKKLALEFLLVEFLKLLSDELIVEFPELLDSSLGVFLKNVNQFNKNKHKKQGLHEQDKQGFLEENYHLYRHLTDYDVFIVMRAVAESQKNSDCVELARRLYYRHLPQVYPLNQQQYHKAREVIARLQLPSWQLALLSCPSQSYQGNTDPILVKYHNSVKPLSDVSLMVSALSDKFENYYYLSVDVSLLGHMSLKSLLKEIEEED